MGDAGGQRHFIYPRERVDNFGVERSSREFPRLVSDLANFRPQNRASNICIITQDFVGPVKNGGIGTAYTYAAKAFAEAGHKVTVLFTINASFDKNLEYWRDHYEQLGIEFVVARDPDVELLPGQIANSMRLNFRVFEWLKQHEDRFDFVHASEWNANAYLCLQAKSVGLHFQNTKFIIKCSSPTLWNRIGNSEPIEDAWSLSVMYMERKSVELADYVICGSQYLLNWMEDHGYLLPPGRTYVQPNIFPLYDVVDKEHDEAEVGVKELVFFGRLEPRKGLHFFIDALLQLYNDGFFGQRELPQITLLGKPKVGYDLKAQLAKITSAMGVKVTVLGEKNQPQALEYLSSGEGRVVVMPSLMDNSPFGVYECLARKVPFITSTAGGGKELIEASYHGRVLFDPTPRSLASRLKIILNEGCVVARSSFDFAANISEWMNWHEWLQEKSSRDHPIPNKEEMPLVSVCIAHYNRGELLKNALASITQQTYQNIEVIIVDDGSTDQRSIEILEDIDSQKFAFPVNIVRQPNSYLGAVRNTAIEDTRGEFILFMDEDNEAKPHEVATFVKTAQFTAADVLTCFSDSFMGDRPSAKVGKHKRIVFQGPNLALGLVKNPYGDSNCFVRTAAAKSIGGFTEHYKVGCDDVEFLSRAVLSGLKVELVPESLYWYRINKERMRNGQYSLFAGKVRVSETYVQGLHPDIANLLRYVQGATQKIEGSVARNREPVQMRGGLGEKGTNKTSRRSISAIYQRIFGKPIPNSFLEFGRRVVYRFPFLYKYAHWLYRRL